jgi:hypothetical protein
VNEVAAPNPAADFMSLIFDSTLNRERNVDMQALTMAVLGMTDLKNNHNLNALEMKYPFESIFINQIGRPLVQSYLGGMGKIAGGGSQKTSGPAPSSAEAKAQPDAQSQIDVLRKQMEDMQQELKRSQDQISRLSKRKKEQ